MRDQLKANPANAPILDQATAAISELEAGRHVDAAKLDPSLGRLFQANVQDFLIKEMSLSPTSLIASYRGPVLILQGSKDIQVGVEDAELLKKAKPDAELKLSPSANHVLKLVPSDDLAANIATYADPSLPLAPDIAPAVARFIKSGR